MKRNVLSFIGFFVVSILVLAACKNGTTDEEPYTYIGSTVPVYLDGVSIGNAASVIGEINKVYDNIGPTQTNFKNNISEIRILPAGSGISHVGKVIFIGANETEDPIGTYLGANGFFAMLHLDKAIRLV